MGDSPSRTKTRSWRSERFERTYPGESLRDIEPHRLMVRLPPEPKQRVCAGETIHLGKGRTEPRYTHRLAEVGPNAPLLKRLMNTPYALYAERPVRNEGREPIPWQALGMARRETTAEVLSKGRVELRLGNPVRKYGDRVQTRPRASADAWLGGGR